MLFGALAIYLIISLGIGLLGRWRVRPTLEGYFAGNRRIPWWAAALSMVATTFAVDTPLAITEYVREGGLAANWRWWNMLMGGILSTVVFAPLWRQSGVLTDSEFLTIRYGNGFLPRLLRAFRALYMGIFINLIIMGWVQLAMLTVLRTFIELSASQAWGVLVVATLVTVLYTLWGGLWSVVWADVLQLTLALSATTLLMVRVITRLDLSQVPAQYWSFWPGLDGLGWGLWGAVAFLGLQWWASWYPGAEPAGGGYILQRMASTPSPHHAQMALAFFQVLHYIVRPITWFAVALGSLIVFPTLTDHKAAYLLMGKQFLSPTEQVFLLIGLVGAYTSTISTHLNWGASYIANDLGLDEKSSWTAGRWTTFALGILSLGVVPLMDSVAKAWNFLLETGAGMGLVLITRWFWKRISVYSELTALIAPPLGYLFFHGVIPLPFPQSYIATVAWTVGWVLLVSLVGKPTPEPIWAAFQAKVRPTLHPRQLFLWLLGVSGGYLTLAGLLELLRSSTFFSPLLLLGLGALILFFYLLKRKP
jgi:SSS family solute:Na+ symporter